MIATNTSYVQNEGQTLQPKKRIFATAERRQDKQTKDTIARMRSSWRRFLILCVSSLLGSGKVHVFRCPQVEPRFYKAIFYYFFIRAQFRIPSAVSPRLMLSEFDKVPDLTN